ncbi:hypothetical protein VTJ49DRAFT_2520 [Mycothermus thermophilus]|uniref:Uncharacterized protein n=1 Tax=Humicola insolens TaxID=85995 RepID=A0ABR3V9P8_HUMIN
MRRNLPPIFGTDQILAENGPCAHSGNHSILRQPDQTKILTSRRVRGPSPWLAGLPAPQARRPPQGQGQVLPQGRP